MAVRCITKMRLPRAAWFASASGMVMAGASAASRSVTDLTGWRGIHRALILKTRPTLRPGLCFSARGADRTQHRFARPAINLEPGRFLIGAERRARLHPRLAVELVVIETDAREVTLHGFDIGGAHLGRSRPWRR